MANILIIDDDDIFSTQLSLYIDRMGSSYERASDMKTGLEMAAASNFDIIFLDVVLPDSNGLTGINQLKSVTSKPEVVIITGDGDADGAEIALNNGAWDYLVKPPAFNKIKLLVKRIHQFRTEKSKNFQEIVFNRDAIIGKSQRLKDCIRLMAKSANSEGNVFISGETGTGKELAAKILHENSRRSHQPFVTLDCTNLPENLASTILFGHRKGTFTGAEKNRTGIIEAADGGTLFLDEVADLTPSVQRSLLRVLQEKRFRSIGAKEETFCDFRVICASNKNLKDLVDKGSFRQDLYYRLVVFHIELPPLRQRKDDIKLLVNHYVGDICEQMETSMKGISKDFIETLECYDWPGNVRELINLLHLAIANAFDDPMLYPHFLPKDFRIKILQTKISSDQNEDMASRIFLTINKSGSRQLIGYKAYREYVNYLMESKYIDYLATFPSTNVSEICRLSGLSRSRLYQLLQKHNKSLR